ncbi:hypothetical protein LQR30_08935 [Chromobacterium piscinae]|nr:hypothetical protein [Chromobacterium piscinae]MCD4504228.1 hypothetical protein [Chromobacterium piscinae]
MPLLQIQQLQYALPDGCQPFPALGHAFPFRRTGLVGRTVAANRCWGSYWQASSPLMPDTCCAGGGIHLLPQELDPDTHPTVAHLAGMAETLAALRSVRDGSLDVSATTNCFKTIGIANHRFNNCCPTPA